jgi:hypothetical protein
MKTAAPGRLLGRSGGVSESEAWDGVFVRVGG